MIRLILNHSKNKFRMQVTLGIEPGFPDETSEPEDWGFPASRAETSSGLGSLGSLTALCPLRDYFKTIRCRCRGSLGWSQINLEASTSWHVLKRPQHSLSSRCSVSSVISWGKSQAFSMISPGFARQVLKVAKRQNPNPLEIRYIMNILPFPSERARLPRNQYPVLHIWYSNEGWKLRLLRPVLEAAEAACEAGRATRPAESTAQSSQN